MRQNLFQEFYKFIHRKAPLYGFLVFIFLILYTGIVLGISKNSLSQGLGTGQWATLVLATIAASFFAMEFQHHTVDTLFYRSSHRIDVYLAKLIVLALYSLILIVFGTLLTFILKAILAPHQYAWSTIYNQQSLLQNLMFSVIGDVLMIALIISIIIAIVCAIRVNAVSIGIVLGLMFAFLGQGISNALISILGSIMKWSPFNMLNVGVQLMDSTYSQFSHLSNIQIISGTIFYILFFGTLGYVFFTQRRS